MKLINSSPDKEMEIGNHTLQQNVDGQTISLYRFLPGIIMQANSTVTVSIRYKCYKLELYRKTFISPVRLWLSTGGFFDLSVNCDFWVVVS